MSRIGPTTDSERTKVAKKVVTILLIAGLVLLLSLSPIFGTNASGLGVSPSEITVLNALREGEYQRMITIFNAIGSPTRFLLKTEGDIIDWITFYSEDNLTTPTTEVVIPGDSNKKIFVKFRIPGDAANGNYSSTIYAQTLPLDVGGTSVILRAPVKVIVEVIGTQILTGIVRNVMTRDTEVNYPLRIEVDFQNTGNVIAQPEVALIITKGYAIVETLAYCEKSINPDLGDKISIEWNTTDRDPGDYVANVTVTLGERILIERNLPFKLLPIGTLTRKGELMSLSTTEKIVHSSILKILATFRNTGLIDTTAKFIGEVYQGESLVDVIESERTLVEVGSEEALVSYWKIGEGGIYSIKGYVVYDGKTTETKEMRVEVRTEDQSALDLLLNPYALGLAAGLIAVTTVAAVKIRKTSKHRKNRGWMK